MGGEGKPVRVLGLDLHTLGGNDIPLSRLIKLGQRATKTAVPLFVPCGQSKRG